MPVGMWSGAQGGSGQWDTWDTPRVVSRDVSSGAFMEELCTAAGGYGRLFKTLMLQYLGWWFAVVAVPALFLDHHKCEVRLPYFAWILYSATLSAMLVIAVLLELSVVQRLGLLKAGELKIIFTEARWRVPLLCTVLWKLDTYTDVVFIFIARDCGSSLWWASFATFVFGVVFGQLLFNTCFACTDCDHELPASFGFVLLDFKLVNLAVRDVLPFDPDASHLPVSKPVTLRASSHLVSVGKCIGDVAQVSIQLLFISNTQVPHGFVRFSVVVGVMHCLVSVSLVMRDCVQDEWAVQANAHALHQGTVLLPGVQLSTAPATVLSSPSATPPQLMRQPEPVQGLKAHSAASAAVEYGTSGPPPERAIGRHTEWSREIPDLL